LGGEKMKRILERFIDYVQIDTQSQEDAGVVPSTKGQFDLANKLADELKQLGAEKVKVDEHACVTAKIPSNLQDGKKVPSIGFIAHLDTAPDCSGKNVKPQIVENYDGGQIVINKERNILLEPKTGIFAWHLPRTKRCRAVLSCSILKALELTLHSP